MKAIKFLRYDAVTAAILSACDAVNRLPPPARRRHSSSETNDIN